jgi:hypothetical protein
VRLVGYWGRNIVVGEAFVVLERHRRTFDRGRSIVLAEVVAEVGLEDEREFGLGLGPYCAFVAGRRRLRK